MFRLDHHTQHPDRVCTALSLSTHPITPAAVQAALGAATLGHKTVGSLTVCYDEAQRAQRGQHTSYRLLTSTGAMITGPSKLVIVGPPTAAGFQSVPPGAGGFVRALGQSTLLTAVGVSAQRPGVFSCDLPTLEMLRACFSCDQFTSPTPPDFSHCRVCVADVV